VFNAPFSNTRSVAELVVGEIIMLLRRVFPRANAAHGGRWEKSAQSSYEVRGKTLGIVGYGNIGSQLSNLAEAMGMRVIYFDQTDKLRHGNTEPTDSLAELLARSDVVTLHAPLTPATRHLIDAAALARMPPGAVLVNTTRGPLVDEAALVEALAAGRLGGAALDVFEHEPLPAESPLWGMDNVVVTPHIAGPSTADEIAPVFNDNLARWLDGRPLRHVVDRARGY
jgi:D-3-phosphoglycerate dehydrogenase